MRMDLKFKSNLISIEGGEEEECACGSNNWDVTSNSIHAVSLHIQTFIHVPIRLRLFLTSTSLQNPKPIDTQKCGCGTQG